MTVLPSAYELGHSRSYGVEVTTFDRLSARLRALPPGARDVLVVAVVGMFTGADAAVNEPDYRQADWFT